PGAEHPLFGVRAARHARRRGRPLPVHGRRLSPHRPAAHLHRRQPAPPDRLAPNILYSAFALLGTLGGVAGLYLYMGADFLGIAQLLIYIGGILVLILFAVLLPNRIGEMNITNLSAGLFIGAPAAIAVIGLVVKMCLQTPWP